MPRPSRRRAVIRRALPGLLTAAVPLFAAPGVAAADTLNAQKPEAVSIQMFDGYIVAHVIARATTGKPHTRPEYTMTAKCTNDTPRGIEHIAGQQAAATRFVTLPGDVTILSGSVCNITVNWLIGGGGPGAGAASGTSPPLVIGNSPDVSPLPRPRFVDPEKAAAQRAADDAALAARAWANTDPPQIGYPMAAVKAAQAAYYNQVAQDPIDKKYKQRVKRRKVTPRKVSAAAFGSAAPAMNAWLATLTEEATWGSALVATIDKAQGATKVKNKKTRKRYETRQMLDASTFAAGLGKSLAALAAKSRAAAAGLRACGCPMAAARADGHDYTALGTSTIFDGLPAALGTEVKRFSVTPVQLRDIRYGLGPFGELPLSYADLIDNAQQLFTVGNVAKNMKRWAKAIKKHPLKAA